MKDRKSTRGVQIEKLPLPKRVSISTLQHIGAPCEVSVAVGDDLLKGQQIGAPPPNALGCPVHSSVSGKVVAIEERILGNCGKISHIVIETNGEETLSPDIVAYQGKISDLSAEQIIEILRKAGISGMGGAGFPTYAKIQSAIGKVDKLIVNAAECEPYITANHRLMLEDPAAIINGTKILLKALGLRQGYIAIEDNKLDAANKIESLLLGSELIKVKIVKTKYPQGDERQLIYALTGRELPCGSLPADVGCVVFNTETCAAVYRAFALGMPLIERIVTVDGDCIKEPKNLLVPIGTPYSDLISYCGGFVKTPSKIINGGPMMGSAQWDLDSPVTKTTSAILAFSEDLESKYDNPPVCIRCGRCVSVCPMHLMPNYLALFASKRLFDKAEEYNAMSCVECGSCSYICPGQVPIVSNIRTAKAEIHAKRCKR